MYEELYEAVTHSQLRTPCLQHGLDRVCPVCDMFMSACCVLLVTGAVCTATLRPQHMYIQQRCGQAASSAPMLVVTHAHAAAKLAAASRPQIHHLCEFKSLR
jgi:hypothetical protein